MKSSRTIKQSYLLGSILMIAGIVLFFSIKKLFFFDEDIFVTDKDSVFFKPIWQRAPICKFIYVAENVFFGKNPVGYHITNLFIHLADAVMGILVLKNLLKLCGVLFTSIQLTVIPFVFFLIFLCSPIHSESLCYILGRDGSLVALFCLLSIFFYLKAGLRNNKFLWLSLLSFLFSLFTYEVAWLLPFIILAITIFWCYVNKLVIKKKVLFALPFLILFGLWFLIKIVLIDKMEISDYKNESLLKIDFLTLLKNNVILFLRNFIPPLKDTKVFILLSGLFGVAFITALFKLYKKQKPVFFFCILLTAFVILGFLPTGLIGIDSHDSESERYIYFSSCFAIMLMAVLLVSIIKSRWGLITLVGAICIAYFFMLNKTINYYNSAGDFSKNYLSLIKANTINKKTVILIDMPAQYKGALMFRAKSRMDNNVKNSITTINEFMTYLYPQTNDTTHYIALSSTEMIKIPNKVNVYYKPMDSVNYYYPLQKIDLSKEAITTDKEETFTFLKPQTTIVALKDSSLFIFK